MTEENENKSEAPIPDAASIQPEPAAKKEQALFDFEKLGIINDLSVVLNVEIGKAQIKIRDLLNLTKGSVLELNKQAGEPVDVYVSGKLIATGTIITANGKYCIRLASMAEKKSEVEENEPV